jgi:hypothetical protein
MPPLRRLFILALLIIFIAACSPSREIEAALVLADIAAGDEISLLKKITDPPRRTAISFRVADRHYAADLYRPDAPPLAAIVLIPGAAPEGRDDPRLGSLANSLARARFAVLVPDIVSLRTLRVESGNIDEIAHAIEWLARQPELAPPGRVGLAAMSFAAGPAILASLEPEIRRRVQFILAVGGYYDLQRVLSFFTTGYYSWEGQWRRMEPNEYGKWVFIYSNVHRIEDPLDRELFRVMAARKLDDLAAEVEELAAGLGPEGRRLYAFIANRDPALVPQFIAGLPTAIRTEIDALDLASRDFSHLTARLILLHGYDDDIIPYIESVDLARAAPETELFLVRGLAHVDLAPGIRDLWKLWRAVSLLLSEREKS